MSGSTRAQTLRFIIVGASAAALQFLLTYLLMRIWSTPFNAAAAAYVAAFIYAYLLHRQWTFSTRQAHRRTLPRYAIAQIGCALLGGVVAEVCAAHLRLDRLPVAAASTIAASGAAYVLSVRWVFAEAQVHDR